MKDNTLSNIIGTVRKFIPKRIHWMANRPVVYCLDKM